MAPMPPAVLTDANLMQEYIQRERRVELFYENWRYWATRLYMESDDPIELAKEKTILDQRVGRMLKANVVHTA